MKRTATIMADTYSELIVLEKEIFQKYIKVISKN